VDLGVYPGTKSKVRALEAKVLLLKFPPTKFMPYLLELVN